MENGTQQCTLNRIECKNSEIEKGKSIIYFDSYEDQLYRRRTGEREREKSEQKKNQNVNKERKTDAKSK